MKIISYNIQYGLGRDGVYDLNRIAAEVADADIIALQEVERFWKRSGMVDQPAELGRLLPDHHWVYGANLDMDASYRSEGGALINRRRQFGTMLMSRMPILSSRNFPLPKLGLTDHHSIQQGALECVINTEFGPVRFYSIHLSHLCPETRLPQIRALLDIHARAPAEGGAWCGGHPDPKSGWTEGAMPPMPDEAVLLGDFNFEPGSEEYALLTGPMTQRYGRLGSIKGFFDSWTLAGNEERSGQTIADQAARIDYCFLTAGLRRFVRKAHIQASATGSDHFPLEIALS
ncbi:endonuclease/exonuclease/phosphatase family protein [uncultured Tateyamaria sp.]|uniref:endonuclease/exonuclease/phosphatase family protein n=1 Tax=uncultured Tateyamaria sp. TaxID=455651 RepID=UPI00261526E7|nr:endonuclease/exonuclease/phosphatase family protein [uncultured Tateyamaria sp.]